MRQVGRKTLLTQLHPKGDICRQKFRIFTREGHFHFHRPSQ